jgi:hypothetical protein
MIPHGSLEEDQFESKGIITGITRNDPLPKLGSRGSIRTIGWRRTVDVPSSPPIAAAKIAIDCNSDSQTGGSTVVPGGRSTVKLCDDLSKHVGMRP